LSDTKDVERFAKSVRGHWGVENSLHWSLDVSFNEDQSRIRKGYSAENFAVVRHIALNVLKKESSVKQGVSGKVVEFFLRPHGSAIALSRSLYPLSPLNIPSGRPVDKIGYVLVVRGLVRLTIYNALETQPCRCFLVRRLRCWQ
jgi:hypothetical protein